MFIAFSRKSKSFIATKQHAFSRKSNRKVWNPNRQAAAEKEDRRDQRTGSAITSFIILFMTLAAEWEFYLQFLE